jgi:hypothetical protein
LPRTATAWPGIGTRRTGRVAYRHSALPVRSVNRDTDGMRGSDVLTVTSMIVLALCLVTPLGGAAVATSAGVALVIQGLYALFRRTHRRTPITAALRQARAARPWPWVS